MCNYKFLLLVNEYIAVVIFMLPYVTADIYVRQKITLNVTQWAFKKGKM